MKKLKRILAGLVLALTLMLGITFTGASVSNSSAVAEDIQKPGHGAVAAMDSGGSMVGSNGNNAAKQSPLAKLLN